MDYFKHYSTSSDSKLINHLMDEFGHAGYAYWFLLLELCAENWDGQGSASFRFHTRIVRQKLRISQTKLELFLTFCQGKGNLLFNFHKSELEIDMPKLLEVKTSRKVIKSNKKQSTVYIDKDIDKDIDKEDSRASCQPSFSIDACGDIWNEVMPDNFGRSSWLSGQQISKASEMFQVLKTKKDWYEYFEKIKINSKFNGSGKIQAMNYAWAMKPENLSNVLSSKEKEQTPEEINSQLDKLLSGEL
jgi:hypothetical protein